VLVVLLGRFAVQRRLGPVHGRLAGARAIAR
jgi:hypothetical protein